MSTTRGYLTANQYQQIVGESLPNNDVAMIGKAEAIIDGHLGNWQPWIGHINGVAGPGTSGSTIQLSQTDQNSFKGVNRLKGCIIELISGAADGNFGVINSQDSGGNLTLDNDFGGNLSPGDVYHIFQMGKVPRLGEDDITTFDDAGVTVYSRNIPMALREAVAFQTQYMIEMGDEFFNGPGAIYDSETIGSYSYSKGDNAKGGRMMIAPKARQALAGQGLINRTAQIVGY